MKKPSMSLWGIGPTFVVISLLLCLPAGYVAYEYRALFALTFAPASFYALGAVCAGVGLWLWIAAGSRVDGYIRQGTLADKGIYGLVRHPLYAGIFLVFSGLFVISRSVVLIAAALPVYIVLRLLLKREEATMYQVFGEDYAAYAKEVNAIFPKLRAFVSAFFYPEKTRQISDNLYVIQSCDVNLYVYTDGQTTICIDTGYDDPHLPAEFARVGLHTGQIDAVFLTHSDVDHIGGSGLFDHAPLYLGREEEKLINHSVGRFTKLYKNHHIARPYNLLDDNQNVTIGNIHIQAIATPGHTIGHTSYLVDDTWLFTGDAVTLQNGQMQPFYRLLSMNHRQTITSFAKIKATRAQWLCTAHTGIGASNAYGCGEGAG
jgi:glyoxylase-like metal-dependent hydrolase (beta-lactamase superfamily II)/protein-S-isoprenylcysteine O-methyltransferase Ste14